jgi:hypothetical protein
MCQKSLFCPHPAHSGNLCLGQTRLFAGTGQLAHHCASARQCVHDAREGMILSSELLDELV